MASCEACPRGTFGAVPGLPACTPCPYGTASDVLRANNATACTPCATPSLCPVGSAVPLSQFAVGDGGSTGHAPEGTDVTNLGTGVATVEPPQLNADGSVPLVATKTAATVIGPGSGSGHVSDEESLVNSTYMVPVGIVCGAFALVLLLGHRLFPPLLTRGDLFAKDHVLKAGQAVVHRPTQLGAAFSGVFVLAALLLSWSLAMSPNESFSTGLITSADAANLGRATSSVSVHMTAYGAQEARECVETVRVTATGLGTVDGQIVPTVSTADQGGNGTAVGAMHTATLALAFSDASRSCTLSVTCTDCELATATSLEFAFPWSFQVVQWEVRTASLRMESSVAGVMAPSPGNMLAGRSTAELAWMPSFLVDATQDALPPQLVSVIAGRSRESPESGDTASNVKSTGHMLQFRGGSTRQVSAGEAQVQGGALSLAMDFVRADVAHQTTVSSTLTWTQRSSAVLSAVMSLMGFVALLSKYTEVACSCRKKRRLIQLGAAPTTSTGMHSRAERIRAINAKKTKGTGGKSGAKHDDVPQPYMGVNPMWGSARRQPVINRTKD